MAFELCFGSNLPMVMTVALSTGVVE